MMGILRITHIQMIMSPNQHSKLWTKQLLKSTQILKTVPTTLSYLDMSACLTTSATMEPSSPTVLVLLISGMDLEASLQKTVSVLASWMFAAKILTSSLLLLLRSSTHPSVEEGTRMDLE